MTLLAGCKSSVSTLHLPTASKTRCSLKTRCPPNINSKSTLKSIAPNDSASRTLGSQTAKQTLDSDSSRPANTITAECRERTLRGNVSSSVFSGDPPIAPGRRAARAASLVRSSTRYGPTSLHRSRGECGSVTRARPGQATLAIIAFVVEWSRRANNLCDNM